MGHCEQEQLHAAMLNGQPSLVIMDVEGAEGHLLNPGNIPGLANELVFSPLRTVNTLNQCSSLVTCLNLVA